jgi:hypothetical protein
MDPKRKQLIRHIQDARKIAQELDDQITDYVLELSLKEAMRDVSPQGAASAGIKHTGW